MLKSKFYRKYYPIKDIHDFSALQRADLQLLVQWIRSFPKELEEQNAGDRYSAMIYSYSSYKALELEYHKDIHRLVDLLLNQRYSELDAEDIALVNTVIFRHKYNGLISKFVFPTQLNDKDKAQTTPAEMCILKQKKNVVRHAGAFVPSPIGDLTIDRDGLQTAVDEICRLQKEAERNKSLYIAADECISRIEKNLDTQAYCDDGNNLIQKYRAIQNMFLDS